VLSRNVQGTPYGGDSVEWVLVNSLSRLVAIKSSVGSCAFAILQHCRAAQLKPVFCLCRLWTARSVIAHDYPYHFRVLVHFNRVRLAHTRTTLIRKEPTRFARRS
jgi:hypothetical protein